MEKSLVLASNNKGKLREFQAMFAEFGVDVINQGALGVEACPEPSAPSLRIVSPRLVMRRR